MTDTRLGRLLWSCYLDLVAEKRSVHPIGIADALRQAHAEFSADEVTSPRQVALSKALEHAAKRRYSAAGHLGRGLMKEGVHVALLERVATKVRELRGKQVQAGIERAEARVLASPEVEKRYDAIRAEYARLMAGDLKPQAARLTGVKFKLTAGRIRQIVKRPKPKRKSR